ncbi:unnamed protein product [Musa textilis]
MAAEVSSMATTLGAHKEEAEGESELVTRDLLGGGAAGDVDLQLHVPAGWPTRIDLAVCVAARSSIHCSSRCLLEFQSDLAFILIPRFRFSFPPPPPPLCRRFESSSFILALIRLRASRFPWLQSGKASLEQRDPNPAPRHLHDLNLSPPVASLGLKLASPSAEYQSVCTLEKVKSALERESRLAATTGPASPPPSSSTTTTTTSSSSSSSSSASTKRRAPTSPDEDGAAGSTMAVAACPVCLLYVLVSKSDPRCPRCAAHVPVNDLKKKPRIDLNSSLPSH